MSAECTTCWRQWNGRGGVALRGTRSNGGRKAARHPNAGGTVRQPVSSRKASCQCLSAACHLYSSLAADICQKVETPRSLIVTTNNASPSLCHATGQIIFFKVAKHLTLNVLPPFFGFRTWFLATWSSSRTQSVGAMSTTDATDATWRISFEQLQQLIGLSFKRCHMSCPVEFCHCSWHISSSSTWWNRLT